MIGRRFDARRLTLPFPFPHILNSGLTRSGKSGTNHVIIGQLAARPDVALVGLDPKRTDLGLWRPRFTTVAVTFDTIDHTLHQLRQELDDRADTLTAAGELKWSPKHGPWIVVVIDEYAELNILDRYVVGRGL